MYDTDLHGGNDEPPMNDELWQASTPLITIPAMHEQQPPHVAELGDGEVTGQAGLLTLLTN